MTAFSNYYLLTISYYLVLVIILFGNRLHSGYNFPNDRNKKISIVTGCARFDGGVQA